MNKKYKAVFKSEVIEQIDKGIKDLEKMEYVNNEKEVHLPSGLIIRSYNFGKSIEELINEQNRTI